MIVRILPIIFVLFITLLFLLVGCSQEKSIETQPAVPEETVDEYGIVIDSLDTSEDIVRKNETLADIMLPYNLSYLRITEIAKLARKSEIFDFRKIRPGKTYKLYFNQDSIKSLNTFIYAPDDINYIVINLMDSIKIEQYQKKIVVEEKTISGEISSSLYETLISVDASAALAVELAEVFAWQIDFYTIQKGDKFFCLYQEKFVEGESVGIGKILAAKFIHKGYDFNAFLFRQDNKNDYFDEKGNSLHKEFLRAPLKYKRISSRYSRNRLHPVLRIYRPHLGIDYAAAVGTPVQAVGDGIVVEAQHKGANGKYVKLKHNSTYSSGYLHLSGYGKGIKRGAKVLQGQVIGYVGSTGLSSGPHLDFRFWKNGTLVNYLTQEFPSSFPVKDENKTDYNSSISNYMIQLDSLKNNFNPEKSIALQ